MNRLETALPVLLANLNRASDNLNALLDDENRRAVKATLADLAQLSRTLAARSATIDATLASTARTMDAAARTTDKAAAVAAELPQLVQRIERTAAAFERMATEVAGAGASARGTLDGRARRPRAIHGVDAARSARARRRVARPHRDAAPRRRHRRPQSVGAPLRAAGGEEGARRMTNANRVAPDRAVRAGACMRTKVSAIRDDESCAPQPPSRPRSRPAAPHCRPRRSRTRCCTCWMRSPRLRVRRRRATSCWR